MTDSIDDLYARLDKLSQNSDDSDLYKNMSDADLQTVFNARLAKKQKQNQLNARLQQASALEDMNARNPDRGTSVPTGSVYIPPNPLNTGMNIADHLSAIMDRYKGIGQQSDINSDTSAGDDVVKRALLRKLRNASSTLGTSDLSNAFDGQSGQDYADSNSNVG